jgi:hypothetical protein
VGLSTEVPSWHAFTIGRLNNQSRRYNRIRIASPIHSARWSVVITKKACHSDGSIPAALISAVGTVGPLGAMAVYAIVGSGASGNRGQGRASVQFDVGRRSWPHLNRARSATRGARTTVGLDRTRFRPISLHRPYLFLALE